MTKTPIGSRIAKPFQNIPDHRFTVQNDLQEMKTITCEISVSAEFIFNQFAAVQFIMGSSNVIVEPRLMELLLNAAMVPNGHVTASYTRADIMKLVELLQSRMRHCEYERDNGSERFNPDTYIAQKMLLLDLKEWLYLNVIC